MMYPLISEYVDAIRLSEDSFDKLSNLRPELDDDGNPIMSSGNYAVVFKMKDTTTDKVYAVKCFTREQEEREERYREIIKVLDEIESPYFVSTHYYDKELFVDTSQSDETEFPVLVMDWVEGMPLDKYMKTIEGSQFKRELLAKQFQRLVCWLLPKHFAHGDVKPDNIIVKEDGSLVLVDYDGMFVPALRGKSASEMGTPFYRHSTRTLSYFNEYIDDYAAVVILLFLTLNEFASVKLNSFFTDDTSKLLRHIEKYVNHPKIAPLLSAYILVSTFGRIDRQQLSCLLSDNSDFDYTKESALQDLARQGDTVAMNELGKLYLKGVYVPQNTAKAMQWYSLSKMLGNVDANCGLCKSIAYNNDFIINNEILRKQLQNNRVGFAYCKEGELSYTRNNYESAVIWFQKAIDLGFTISQGLLGLCNEQGYGMDKNLVQAVSLYRIAADSGYSYAQRNLANCYFTGRGVDKNMETAAFWYKKAADAGYSIAQRNLAGLYQRGEGVDKDLGKAVYWCQKAAEAGDSRAQRTLAILYKKGECVEKDLEKALYWLTLAAEAGDSAAQGKLALHYFHGEGVEKDLEKAVYLWKKSADNNYYKSHMTLGICYENGLGVTKDIEQALFHYTQAAYNGVSDAEFLLESCCKERNITDVVNAPSSATTIGVQDYGQLAYTKDGKRLLAYWRTNDSVYRVEQGTEVICDDCFSDLDLYEPSLKTLYLPASLRRIGNNAFCASISEIICDSPIFYTQNGFLLSRDDKTIYRYFGEKQTVIIPDGARYIKGGSFSGKSIERVTIPSSVVHIGNNPFIGCNSLKEIVSNSQRFGVIDKSLYNQKEKCLISCWDYYASHIYVQPGTRILGKKAFFGLQVQFIHLPDSIDSIDSSAFDHCSELCGIIISPDQFNRIQNLLPTHVKKYAEVIDLPF